MLLKFHYIFKEKKCQNEEYLKNFIILLKEIKFLCTFQWLFIFTLLESQRILQLSLLENLSFLHICIIVCVVCIYT